MSEVSTPSLFATVVKLSPVRPGAIPATQGHLAHAAFLDMVRTADPPLAEELHGSGGRKPFTVSPLRGLPLKAREGSFIVRPDDDLWLRFTLMDAALFQTFIRYFLEGKARPAIRIGSLDLQVSEVLATAGSHPWAGHTSAGELVERWLGPSLAEGMSNPVPHRIALELASPTAFSLGQRPGMGKWMEVFPTPELLFGNLVSAWNRLGVFPLPAAEVRRRAQETVVVSRFRLETRIYRYRGYEQVGAEGKCSYELKGRARPDMARCLNLLADYAFYAGVGYHTTMGMGQARRLPTPNPGGPRRDD